MTIPPWVKDNHLDDNIKDLVINLNRIPGIHTLTNCEGHEEYAIPDWPTKDGWIYFFMKDGTHPNLIAKLKELTEKYDYMTFREQPNFPSEGWINYTINALFEPHYNYDDGSSLFEKMSHDEQQTYLSRAAQIKAHFIERWFELNQIVVNYIKETITQDVKSLPYRED